CILCDDLFASFRIEPSTLHQRGSVLFARESSGVINECRNSTGGKDDLFMVRGRGDVGRKIENIRKVVVIAKRNRLKIENGGDQNDAIEKHAVALQIVDKSGRARRSV